MNRLLWHIDSFLMYFFKTFLSPTPMQRQCCLTFLFPMLPCVAQLSLMKLLLLVL
jgi:hypothetical protein